VIPQLVLQGSDVETNVQPSNDAEPPLPPYEAPRLRPPMRRRDDANGSRDADVTPETPTPATNGASAREEDNGSSPGGGKEEDAANVSGKDVSGASPDEEVEGMSPDGDTEDLAAGVSVEFVGRERLVEWMEKVGLDLTAGAMVVKPSRHTGGIGVCPVQGVAEAGMAGNALISSVCPFSFGNVYGRNCHMRCSRVEGTKSQR
jgi:hypothetical protein